MKHVTTFIFALALSLSIGAYAQDTYHNATFNFDASNAVNYSMGGITISAGSGTIIGDPFVALNINGTTVSAGSGTIIGDPFVVQNANGITTNAGSGTIIGDPFAVQNPQTNSTDMSGLLSYMSAEPFNVVQTGLSVSYNVMESTNNPLISVNGAYCGATAAVVELVDASNGSVLATLNTLPSFCGVSWLLGLSTSYTYNIPASFVNKSVYIRLHISQSGSYPYNSFASTSLTNLGWSPFVATLLGKQVNTDVAGTTQLLGNYPNPVVNTTAISVQNTMGATSLKVYDALGRMVADLSQSLPQTSGVANVVFDASQLKSGVYFYRLQSADGAAAMREMVVNK